MIIGHHRILAVVGALVVTGASYPGESVDAAPSLTQTISCGDTAALVTAVASATVTTVVLNGNHVAGCTYTFTAPYAGSRSALPSITRPLTIAGNGSALVRQTGSVSFRLISVAAPGDLQLNDTAVSDGNTQPFDPGGGIYVGPQARAELTGATVSGNIGALGGGIYNAGILSLGRSTVSGNSADIFDINRTVGGGGGVYNDSGVVAIDQSVISGNEASGRDLACGAGIYNGGGIVKVVDTAVTANRLIGAGAGICTGSLTALTLVTSFVGAGVTALIRGSVRDNVAYTPAFGPPGGGGIDSGGLPEVVVADGVLFSGNVPNNCPPGQCVPENCSSGTCVKVR